MSNAVYIPEQAGVPSAAVERLLDEIARRGLEPHAIMIAKNGKLVAKLTWSPYDEKTPCTLFSLSKSFCSCAAGFAVAEGLMTYDTPILDILPDKAPKGASEALRRITVGDLLCMGSGMDPKSDSISRRCRDWAKAFLRQSVLYPPRERFHYNTIGTYMVSRAVQRVTGQTCRDYLMPRLFDKLGIRRPQWDCCPQGVNCGGFGLHLSCEDILKFGQLLLDDGVWQGERVLPEGWVETATGKKIDNFDGDSNNDWQQGYGYQFWRTRGGRYRGDGMYGQICMVDAARGIVVAVTAGIMDMGGEMEAINAFFETLDAPFADAPAQHALQQRIAALRYDFPSDDGAGHTADATYADGKGRAIRVETNPDDTLCLRFSGLGNAPVMSFLFGRGAPRAGEMMSFVPGEQPYATLSAYGWQGRTLRAVARVPNAPYALQAELTFDGDALHVRLCGAGFPNETLDLKLQMA